MNLQILADQARDWLFWLPDWALGLMFMAAAAAIAIFLHSIAVRVLRRIFGSRAVFAQSLMSRIYGPSRFALVIFAVAAVIPAARLPGDLTAVLARLLIVAFVVMVGWCAVAAVQLATDIYLRRWKLDVEDNLLARKHVTQMRVLTRTANTLIVLLTVAAALMTFPAVRQYGVSLFASAGAAGIVVGFAARPVLSNLIAGIQLAITQPIRIEDAVIVEGEYGWVEEIASTYVVLKLWDWRRMVVPLTYFIEKPFQNWTRSSSELIGSVMLWVDYSVPVERVRAKLEEIAAASALWDKKVVNLQVVDATDRAIQLRALVSARSSPRAWDLRCEVREKLIEFLRDEYPGSLPRQRAEFMGDTPVGRNGAGRTDGSAPMPAH